MQMRTRMLHILLLFLFLFPGGFAWWDADWSARMPFETATAVTVNNYQLKVNITYDSDMKTDFSDIRIIGSDDITELPYWIEEKVDSGWASIWIKDSFATTNLTRYIYFGNSGATSKSDGYPIFELFDEFSGSSLNTTTWDTYGDGDITVGSGYIRIEYGTAETGISSKLNITSNLAIYSTLHQEGAGYSYIGYRHNAVADRWFLNARQPDNEFRLYQGGNLINSSAGVSSGTTYKTKITAYGDNHHIYIDDVLKMTAVNSASKNNGLIRIFTLTQPTRSEYIFVTKFIENEPTYSVGSKEYLAPSTSFSFTPASPKIYENVNFTATYSDVGNIVPVRYWWDFDDGNSVVTEVNITSHSYLYGGVFNVSLVLENSTGANLTHSRLVTVWEPTITIRTQNNITSAYISTFSVVAYNTTQSHIFSTTDGYARWNFTEGPSGNVSIEVRAPGYNHTSAPEIIEITHIDDVNFTAQVYPAFIILSPRDYDFPFVAVPVQIRITNETTSLTDIVAWDTTVSYTTTSQGQSSSYISAPAQTFWFKYQISTGGSGSTTTAKLVISDILGANNITLYEDNCASSCSAYKEGLVVVSRAGTYAVYNITTGATLKSGTVPYFPVLATISGGFGGTGGTGNANFFMKELPLTYSYYFASTNISTGDVRTTTSQYTGELFGYLSNLYSENYLFFSGVSEYSQINRTVWMFPSATSSLITFSVSDADGTPIEGATVSIFKIISGNTEIIGSGKTDATGSTQFYTKIGEIYSFVVSSPGTSTASGEVLSLSGGTSVNVRLVTDESMSPSALDQVYVSISPDSGTPIKEGECVTFTVTILDSLAHLNSSFLFLDGTLTNSSTSSAGATFTNYVCFENSTSFPVTFGFWRGTNATNMQYFSWTYVFWVFEDGGLIKFRENVENLGAFRWVFGLLLIAGGYLAGGVVAGMAFTLIAFIIGLVGLDIILISIILGIGYITSQREGVT